MANMSKVNFFGKIRRGSRVLENPIEVKAKVVRFFVNLYKGDIFDRPKLEGVSFPSLPLEVQAWMEREFEEEEVVKALEECGGDKAPGPDEFNFSFIRAAWGFLKEDLCSGSRKINATFLTLILKVPNPMELRDYRPISLVGCMYKLLDNILANRLKMSLPLIISPYQRAFVAGRKISTGC